jgi:predicted solute-binding protein
MDLGAEWLDQTGLPMVFGVFCARQDSEGSAIRLAVTALEENLDRFETSENHRTKVIESSSERTRFSFQRISHYFQSEVRNRLNEQDRESMILFAQEVCGFEGLVPWWDGNHESSSNSEPVSRRRASS